MTQKIRAVDNDDVLFPMIPIFSSKFHNPKYGTRTRMSDFVTFDIVGLWGITDEDWWNREREFYASDLYKNMQPHPGAHELLEYLSQTGQSHLVTSRGKDVEHHTKSKLVEHFDPHHFMSVHHAGPHIYGGERQSKTDICLELSVTTLLDDFHTTLIGASSRGISGVLFTQPWNKNITDLPKNIYRVQNYYHAIDIIEKYNL